jgi:hypothetical protein
VRLEQARRDPGGTTGFHKAQRNPSSSHTLRAHQ